MNYKEHFNTFWIPILQRQYFKYMLTHNKEAIEELEDNIWKNWNLIPKDKREILKKIRGEKG